MLAAGHFQQVVAELGFHRALHGVDRSAEHHGVVFLDHLAWAERAQVTALTAGRAGGVGFGDFSEVDGLLNAPLAVRSNDEPYTVYGLIARRMERGPNYDRQNVAHLQADLQTLKMASRIMVDCSHANSGKDPARQPAVFNEVLAQRLAGDRSIVAVMIEGHLFDGCQALGKGTLKYGVSITDGCLGWASTETLLREAAQKL